MIQVLVVEDEEKVAAFIRRGLEHSAYSVDHAFDAEEALHSLQTKNYDVVILDLVLPGTSGLEVVREMKRRKLTTPVLAVSARAEVEDRIKGLEAGCDAYLTKPFALPELLARVRALLRLRNVSGCEELRCGDMRLNLKLRTVSIDGKRIKLTNREFEVLCRLFQTPGQVVSHEDLHRSIWGDQECRHSNIVEVYVNLLRTKIYGPGQSGAILNVRGIGYKLCDPRTTMRLPNGEQERNEASSEV